MRIGEKSASLRYIEKKILDRVKRLSFPAINDRTINNSKYWNITFKGGNQ